MASANVKDRYKHIQVWAANLGIKSLNPINVAGWPGTPNGSVKHLTRRWNCSGDIVNTITNVMNREVLRSLALQLAEGNDKQRRDHKGTIFHFWDKRWMKNCMPKRLLYFKVIYPPIITTMVRGVLWAEACPFRWSILCSFGQITKISNHKQ
ncbi:MAG: hypothetical protein IPP37_20335 [Saprospiraceae bacterium]|nr:hypothetical protein [Saprospiraceae bacterium]